MNPDDKKPYECGFSRLQNRRYITLCFEVDKENQMDITYDEKYYWAREKIDGNPTYTKHFEDC